MSHPLQELIVNACSSARFETDLSLHLEICDWINHKGGTVPRVAALTLAQLAGGKDYQQATQALTLLNHCVLNCGYPFHLQLGTKEFLNLLVRRFPAHPPSFQGQQNRWNHFDFMPHDISSTLLLQRILYMIQEWKMALIDKSPYRQDVRLIHDMYQLLYKKGYQFPEVHDSPLVAMMSLQILQSPQELEDHDRIKLSAKLQEHIRLGTPHDLVSADRIIKYLTGHDQRFKPDYDQRFSDQIRGVRSKVIVFHELLESMKPGEEPDQTIQQLHHVIAGVHSKIGQLLESQDISHHAGALHALNHQVSLVLRKWDDIQHHIFDTHYNIFLTATPSSGTNTEPLSLIDLDCRTDAAQDIATPSPEATSLNTATNVATSTPSSQSCVDTSLSLNEPDVLLSKNGLTIHVQRLALHDGVHHMRATFSNHSSVAMENMVLKLAAPKSMTLVMSPIMSDRVPPSTENAVYQDFTLTNRSIEPLRIRFIVTYHQFGVDMEQSGEYICNK